MFYSVKFIVGKHQQVSKKLTQILGEEFVAAMDIDVELEEWQLEGLKDELGESASRRSVLVLLHSHEEGSYEDALARLKEMTDEFEIIEEIVINKVDDPDPREDIASPPDEDD